MSDRQAGRQGKARQGKARQKKRRKPVPGAGFEPAKHYTEDLKSSPFDHSGIPASLAQAS